MKRVVMTALAVVLAAQAPAALAQDRGGGDRAERSEGRADGRARPEGGGVRAQREVSETGGRRDGGEPPRAREAPQAPRAPEASQPRYRGDGGQGRGDRRWDGGGDRPRDDGHSGDDQRGGGRRGDGDGPRGQGRPGGDGGRGEGLVDGRRGDGGDWRRGDQDHRVDGRRDDGWRDRDRRGDGRRDHDRRDGDRRWSGGRDWDRHDDRRDYRRWERGRYPSVYFSSYRYRHAWRPPSGFYVRSWGYGDFYPRSWFGPRYWILDPWQYDLPLPPPGFDWVRSGADALLIDQYTGRIVQVVRNIFWY